MAATNDSLFVDSSSSTPSQNSTTASQIVNPLPLGAKSLSRMISQSSSLSASAATLSPHQQVVAQLPVADIMAKNIPSNKNISEYHNSTIGLDKTLAAGPEPGTPQLSLGNNNSLQASNSSSRDDNIFDLPKMENLSDFFTVTCSGAMIFGGLVPYIPQYLKIKRANNSDGFSTYGKLKTLVYLALTLVHK